MGEAVSGKI